MRSPAGTTVRLDPLSPDAYVRDVLPHTHALWAGARTFDEYAAEFRAIVASPYGRRFATFGLSIDGMLVASCKRYAKEIRCLSASYASAAIGAVFTPPDLRGRGYATALIGAFLDRERDAGTDCVYLFSDLAPAFYQKLGFELLPSRQISIRAASLRSPRVEVSVLGDEDLRAMQKTFAALDGRRPFALRRSAVDWEWQKLRAASREHGTPPMTFGIRRGRSVAAYVTGRRVPSADAFVLDELAFATEADDELITPLLRAAAGDLQTVRGWLPPAVAREVLPRGAVRRRTTATTMLIPISAPFRTAWGHARTDVRDAPHDPCWSTDHV